MRALIINGSPHKNGTTKRALKEIQNTLEVEGVECEIYDLGKEITGCTACGFCKNNGKCIKNDDVNMLLSAFEKSDAFIIGSPVYYAAPNGSVISLLDRLFHSANFDKSMKVGASVVVARRGGLSSSYDVLNKYFGISGMPIATSRYWNQLHGQNADEAEEDKEGLATMRELAKNIAFLIKSIDLGKKHFGLPNKESKITTNFIR